MSLITAAAAAAATSSSVTITSESLNFKQDLTRKFMRCCEYEAHRNYKSDSSQAEKVFVQTIDAMQVQLSECLTVIRGMVKHVREIIDTDNALNNLNAIAVTSKCGFLQVVFLLLHAKVAFEYRDYVKCIYLAKKSKNLA